jgi:hypothetical protein
MIIVVNVLCIGEVIALKHALETYVEFLRESGVGSLPLVPSGTEALPSEQKMIQDMSKSVQTLFEKRQRRQENAAGIASLLTAPDTRGRRHS